MLLEYNIQAYTQTHKPDLNMAKSWQADLRCCLDHIKSLKLKCTDLSKVEKVENLDNELMIYMTLQSRHISGATHHAESGVQRVVADKCLASSQESRKQIHQ